MIRIAAVMAAVALCVASATPYQASGFRGGYDDTPLGPGAWAVHVRVNGYTDRGTAMIYAYRRATELCPSGYDVSDGETSSKMYAILNRNSVDVVEKPEVTLIVRCRAAQRQH